MKANVSHWNKIRKHFTCRALQLRVVLLSCCLAFKIILQEVVQNWECEYCFGALEGWQKHPTAEQLPLLIIIVRAYTEDYLQVKDAIPINNTQYWIARGCCVCLVGNIISGIWEWLRNVKKSVRDDWNIEWALWLGCITGSGKLQSRLQGCLILCNGCKRGGMSMCMSAVDGLGDPWQWCSLNTLNGNEKWLLVKWWIGEYLNSLRTWKTIMSNEQDKSQCLQRDRSVMCSCP